MNRNTQLASTYINFIFTGVTFLIIGSFFTDFLYNLNLFGSNELPSFLQLSGFWMMLLSPIVFMIHCGIRRVMRGKVSPGDQSAFSLFKTMLWPILLGLFYITILFIVSLFLGLIHLNFPLY